MTDYLLAAILVVQVLILIQGTRIGEQLGAYINKKIYDYRLNKFDKEHNNGS